MNKHDIIAYITPEIYVIESEDAWKAAPFTGRWDQSLFYSSDTPFIISDLIWENAQELTNIQKIHLTFEIYKDIPCYTFLSQIYIHYYASLSEEACEAYWKEGLRLLDQAEEALAQPMVYTLAVDFFEEYPKYHYLWDKLITRNAPSNRIRRVLEAAAAVPFPVKVNLYQQLKPDSNWHQTLYDSLRGSYYSIYGDIDKVEAYRLLEQLHIQSTSDEIEEFRQALRQGERYANYFADRRNHSAL